MKQIIALLFLVITLSIPRPSYAETTESSDLSLSQLPNEILSIIMDSLEQEDLENLMSSCHRFNEVGARSFLWKKSCLSLFQTKLAPLVRGHSPESRIFLNFRELNSALKETGHSWRDIYLDIREALIRSNNILRSQSNSGHICRSYSRRILNSIGGTLLIGGASAMTLSAMLLFEYRDQANSADQTSFAILFLSGSLSVVAGTGSLYIANEIIERMERQISLQESAENRRLLSDFLNDFIDSLNQKYGSKPILTLVNLDELVIQIQN